MWRKPNIYCRCKIRDDNFHTVCDIGSYNTVQQNIRIAEM